MAENYGSVTPSNETVEYLTKDQMFEALVVEEEDYPIPGFGMIRLTGVGVKAGVDMLGGSKSDPMERFTRIILAGVKVPKLTVADVVRIEKGKMGTVQNLATAIMRLSGLELKEDGSSSEAEDFLGPTPSPNSSSDSASKNSEDSPAN